MLLAAVARLIAGPVSVGTPPGVTATGSALAKTFAPSDSTASVVSFRLSASGNAFLPSRTAVPLVDPTSGALAGMLSILRSGAFTFSPAPGFVGPVPPVSVAVASTDGQLEVATLTITVNSLLRDGNESPRVAQGSGPVLLNVLDNTVPPPGHSVMITSFSMPGSLTAYPAGPLPAAVVDPITKVQVGTMVVLPGGSVTFNPAAGFTGQTPPATYTIRCSDGQSGRGTLTITVQLGG